MEYLELIKKHGVTACLVFAILFLNSKLNRTEDKIERVEAHLYDCYEDKIQEKRLTTNTIKRNEILAVLPEEIDLRHARSKQEV